MKITFNVYEIEDLIKQYLAGQLEANTERFDITEMYIEYRTRSYNKETDKYVLSKAKNHPFDDLAELEVYLQEKKL
jgi:hypothetical protein